MPPRRLRLIKTPSSSGVRTPISRPKRHREYKRPITPPPDATPVSRHHDEDYAEDDRRDRDYSGHGKTTKIIVNCSKDCGQNQGYQGYQGGNRCGGGDYAYYSRCACPVYDQYGYPYDSFWGSGCGYRGYGGLPWPVSGPVYVPSGPFVNPAVALNYGIPVPIQTPCGSIPITYSQPPF